MTATALTAHAPAPEPGTTSPRRRSTGWTAALAGLLAAGVALGVGELVAGATTTQSPVVAVGDQVVDRVPAGVKDVAISVFGTADKAALVVGTVLLAGIFGALLGLVAARRPLRAAAGFTAFGLVGAAAALSAPRASALSVLPSLLGALAGIGALLVLVRNLPLRPGGSGAPGSSRSSAVAGADRRRFLLLGSGMAVVGAAALTTGRLLGSRLSATVSRAAVALPRPLRPRPPLPPGADLGIEGLTPFTTPNDRFYRIDTAIVVPQVAAENWRLRVHGMVERELDLSFAELLDRPLVEADITLACVSNEVGGDLVGNARWLGARLDSLLQEAGVQAGADQVVGRSVDGFACGFPIGAALDGREALVAVGMNGEPLPVQHGFPARLVVPGLYGYVSATKWLAEIEVTTFQAFDHYWLRRGWAREAPIKTQSRIDTPGNGSDVAAGRVPVAGVAWAQGRGIRRVEVQVDYGDWREARLSEEVAATTWRQWVYEWDAAPGAHVLRVRATDGTGTTQTLVRRPPIPDGASGLHEIDVTVRER